MVSASGSWTLLVTGPDNLTCMLAAGEDWENIPSDIAGRLDDLRGDTNHGLDLYDRDEGAAARAPRVPSAPKPSFGSLSTR